MRELVNGRVTRAEEGIARGKAGSRDPRKAAEEREKMWARLGARRDGDGDGARYAHLLDAGAGDGRVMTNAASMRGRGSNRAALKLGFGAHRGEVRQGVEARARGGDGARVGAFEHVAARETPGGGVRDGGIAREI